MDGGVAVVLLLVTVTWAEVAVALATLAWRETWRL